MPKQKTQPDFIFENPNTPEDFRRLLQKILVQKLLEQYRKKQL